MGCGTSLEPNFSSDGEAWYMNKFEGVGLFSAGGQLANDDSFLPTLWQVNFEYSQCDKLQRLLKKGSFVMFRGLPPSIDYDPNGIWFACNGGTLLNHGATYKLPCDADLTVIGFRCRKSILFTVEDFEANSKLATERATANKVRVRAERAAINASARSFHDGCWHAGIVQLRTHFTGRNPSQPQEQVWWVQVNESVPGNLVWRPGDMIKFRGAGVHENFDINDIWFPCTQSFERIYLEFQNPGVLTFVVHSPDSIQFTAKALDAFTEDELAQNDRLVEELIRPEGNALEMRNRRRTRAAENAVDSVVPPTYVETLPNVVGTDACNHAKLPA